MRVKKVNLVNGQLTFEMVQVRELRGAMKNVYHLLSTRPELRNSGRMLIWEYWDTHDRIVIHRDTEADIIQSFDFFKYATHPETIRRSAAKIRQLFPELRGKNDVRTRRKEKEAAYKKVL